MSPKALVIALDGATLDLVGPWAAAGHLPHLQRLMAGGLTGPLLSTFPPLTGPAWGSFMTGKSPGRHSVLEFFRREPEAYRQALNSRLNLDGKTLWRWLSEAGKAVGVMGVPLTYPPEPLGNGFMMTGLLTPPNRRDFTYPRQLLDELEMELGEPYRLRQNEQYHQSDPLTPIREQYAVLENNTRAALYLMTHKPWDFFMVHFLGTDTIQHGYWHIMDASHPQHNPQQRASLGNVILDFFKAVDGSVGRLLDNLDDETVVLVMSDHGFGPIHHFLNVNTWLWREGLLHLKRTPGARLRTLLFHLGFNYSTMGQWVLRLGLGRQAKELGRARREQLQRRFFLSLDDVDWSRTQVYSMGNFGQLYLNLKGREPQGIVAPGAAAESILDSLTRRLLALADPDSGRPVVERVLRRDEVYEGPYTEQGPDLVFFTRRMEYKPMGLSDFSSPRVFEPVFGTFGHHRPNGLMIWYGPGVIQPGQWPGEAHIQDVAPTILYMMGQPVPSDMDGRVLFDLFTPTFRQGQALSYRENSESGRRPTAAPYSDQDEAQVMEMLRGLGYVT